MSMKKNIVEEVITAVEKLLDENEVPDTPESQLEIMEGITIALCSLMVSIGVEKVSAEAYFSAVYDAASEEHKSMK